MYQQPIDELKLLNSIPGFEELSDGDKLRFRIASFEYKDHPVYSTATLVFTYADHKLKFEMSFSRGEGFCYRHVLYGDGTAEEEFPSLREAIDYCKSLDVAVSS